MFNSHPPSHFRQALTALNAERIGHGFNLFYAEKIENAGWLKKIGFTPQQFVDKLTQYIAANRIPLEVCLSSNLQTLPESVIRPLPLRTYAHR
jgi:adenosine deaminase